MRWLWLLALLALGCTRPDPKVAEIDQAVRKACAYLHEVQRSNGAWVSPRYPVYRDGYSLAPMITLSLLKANQDVGQSVSFMLSLTPKRRDAMVFPVYPLADSVRVYTLENSSKSLTARRELVDFLHAHQLVESLDWLPEDLDYGGWGEAVRPYQRPAPPRKPDPSRGGNISTSVFVMAALVEVDKADPALKKGLIFVERCQNFGEGKDGGFFFSPAYPNRNKATEFRSYGSATGDGLRALLYGGKTLEDPRVQAARKWLLSHFSAEHNSGDFPEARLKQRDSLYYYYLSSMSQALLLSAPTAEDNRTWARQVVEALVKHQKPDGSWSNPVTYMTEDDPLVATPMGIQALLACRAALTRR